MKIIPHLWYTDNAEEAASFYASVLPNSKVDGVTALPVESPSGPAGSVKVVEFTLVGQPFMAISAGPIDGKMAWNIVDATRSDGACWISLNGNTTTYAKFAHT